MKREQIIKSLVNQFAENIKNLPDETLQDVESGKLVISLTPAVGNEAGGAIKASVSAPVKSAVGHATGIREPRKVAPVIERTKYK
ncbi:hypothetical protein Lsan_3383 [Legionella santicrucis]|uniref:Uncharacterized protein n=1 Tax=Legionella santicrucis TaxID=45074 RepID=A0A0W0YG93_9GAMM|nr:hypothetical protein [Legionella santicrucis]KTD55831.1 hypothetical protein Lsan_3383 [Legionella santicrucis]